MRGGVRASKGPASDKWNRSAVRAKMDVERHAVKRGPAEEIDGTNVDMHKTFMDRRVEDPAPTEEQMEDVLRAMGKYTKSDELNCGACGYPSCRAKATAVFQGKAEIGMCLPNAVAQAESMVHRHGRDAQHDPHCGQPDADTGVQQKGSEDFGGLQRGGTGAVYI